MIAATRRVRVLMKVIRLPPGVFSAIMAKVISLFSAKGFWQHF